jgi:hypothetical protein
VDGFSNQRAGKIHFTQDPAEMAIRMTLTVGDKVVYPGRGPCLIGAVVQKVFVEGRRAFTD